MPRSRRPDIGVAATIAAALLLAGCGGGHDSRASTGPAGASSTNSPSSRNGQQASTTSAGSTASNSPAARAEPAGQVRIAFAGDVHFAGRTASRL
ncbi:MAG: hypothetical protein ABI140_11370, partial [Jatrophihabitantaceae bacterium]